MKKSWLLFTLVVLIAAQVVVLSSFYPIAESIRASQPGYFYISEYDIPINESSSTGDPVTPPWMSQKAFIVAANESSFAGDPVTVVISKMNYARVRVDIEITTLWNPAVLLFPNGTQKEIPANSYYMFSVVMPHTGSFFGSYNIQMVGVNLSDNHPTDVEFLSDGSTIVPNYSYLNEDPQSRVSVNWFTVHGDAHVNVKGIGAGF